MAVSAQGALAEPGACQAHRVTPGAPGYARRTPCADTSDSSDSTVLCYNNPHD